MQKVDQRKIWWVRPKTAPEMLRGERMLKKLNKFSYFDLAEFLAGKKLMTLGQQEWKDFNSGERLSDGTLWEVQTAFCFR